MKVFLDFDRTLLDTGKLVRTLYRPALEAEGLSVEQIEKSYEVFASGVDPTKEKFTIERHLQVLSLEAARQAACLPRLQDFFKQTHAFLFPGTKEFLQALSPYEVTILTFGDRKFQNLKVQAAGVLEYCQGLCIAEESKVDEVEKRVNSHEPFVFVDDQSGYFDLLQQRFGERVHGVHFLHTSTEKKCLGCSADMHAEDFDSVIRFIQSVCAA